MKKNRTLPESQASLTTYVMENSPEMEPDRVRPAVIICPGGGYEMLSDREAEPIAIKMMSFGFQAFVLHYSIKPAVYPLALKNWRLPFVLCAPIMRSGTSILKNHCCRFFSWRSLSC